MIGPKSGEVDSEVDQILSEASLSFYRRVRRPYRKTGVAYWDFKLDCRKSRRISDKGTLLRKMADIIFEEFQAIARAFEEAYIADLRKNPQPEILFPWLHAINRQMIDEEVKRAQEETARRCSELHGTAESSNPEASYKQYLTRLKERGDFLRNENEHAINHLVRRKEPQNEGKMAEPNNARVESAILAPGTIPSIFISHSSKDAALAGTLVDLFRSALNLAADEIRCTSVDGYRMPAGADTEMQLRREILAAKVVIGLMTPSSLDSTYVLFELGARWGAEKHLVPLLAGVEPNSLRSPIAELNALNMHSESQLHQLIEDMAKELNRRLQSVSCYSSKISEVARLSIAKRPNTPK